jgi:hypothetical protein
MSIRWETSWPFEQLSASQEGLFPWSFNFCWLRTELWKAQNRMLDSVCTLLPFIKTVQRKIQLRSNYSYRHFIWRHFRKGRIFIKKIPKFWGWNMKGKSSCIERSTSFYTSLLIVISDNDKTSYRPTYMSYKNILNRSFPDSCIYGVHESCHQISSPTLAIFC